MNPAIILIALVLINLFASKKAHTSHTKTGQYIGLGSYILAEAIIFVPLIDHHSEYFEDPDFVPKLARFFKAYFS